MTVLSSIIVGTYEKLILGYELVKDTDEQWSFKIAFTNNSHVAPVRCLAVSATRGILASAGSDEMIRLLDLKNRKEVGNLPYHSGSVNALHFYKASHLFSCSDDGKLVVWRRRDWKMLKAFKRHNGQAVNGVAVHPTGALALSVGNDRTLRTWDLVAGKNAFSINLKKPAQSVLWSSDGSYFAVVFESGIDVYLAETGRICATFPESAHKESSVVPPSKKITTATFILDDTIIFGMESGRIYCATLGLAGTNVILSEIQAHNTRVKGIALLSLPSNDFALLVTAASDGEIKLWRFKLPPAQHGDDSFECLASHKTDFRILSMVVWQPQSVLNKKNVAALSTTGENDELLTEKPKKAKKNKRGDD